MWYWPSSDNTEAQRHGDVIRDRRFVPTGAGRALKGQRLPTLWPPCLWASVLFNLLDN